MIELFLPPNISQSPSSLKTLAHSKMVANAAKLISSKIKSLDPEKAYTYGVFHDIGKFYLDKNESYKHPRKGYEMMKNDYPRIADICISHAFPNFRSYNHILHYCHNDKMEASYVLDILKGVRRTKYVDLIQLCDKLSGLDHYVSIESKLDWYSQNYGIAPNELQICYFKPLNALKLKFDKLVQGDIYDILGIFSA